MDWFKEMAKMCLNLAVLTMGVFVYGSVTHPQWNIQYAVWGLIVFLLWIAASCIFWQIGGRKGV